MPPRGLLALQDRLREEVRSALAALQALGIRSVMLTGDNPRAAAAIDAELGITYRAGLLPADKVAAVRELGGQQPLAMVGDDINDAPAMKAATLGIAMGSGTDVMPEADDAALTQNDLAILPRTVQLARRTRTIIRQNIALALGLKAISLVPRCSALPACGWRRWPIPVPLRWSPPTRCACCVNAEAGGCRHQASAPFWIRYWYGRLSVCCASS